MKKIKILLSILLLIPFTSSCAIKYLHKMPNTNQIIHHNTSIIPQSNAGEFQQTNSAFMQSYGRNFASHNQVRKARLVIKMTWVMYNYLLLLINSGYSAKYFASYLLGPETPYLAPQWKEIQHKIVQGLEESSLQRGFNKDYFYNLFYNWLVSQTGWDSFKEIFTGEDLEYNIYDMPPGYNTEKAQNEFRRNGVIMEFYFKPKNDTLSEWKVSTIWYIFPYTKWTISLLYYYLSTRIEGGQVIHVPPRMNLKFPTPPTKRMTVKDLLPKINDTLKYNFNYPSPPLLQSNSIRVAKNQLSKLISIDRKNPTILNIAFYSQEEGNPQVYISKQVDVYAS